MNTPIPSPTVSQPQNKKVPCPMIFRKWEVFKSMWAAPLVALGVTALIGLVYYLLHNHLSDSWLSFLTAMGFCFLCAAGGTLLVVPVFVPYCFLKQMANPSFMQKAIRFYCLNLMGWGNSGVPPHEEVSFYWWLSHPGQAWPKDIVTWANYLDITSFDWQNPDEWKSPIEKAQKQANHQNQAPDIIENLVIGSHATQMNQQVSSRTVVDVTALFKAVMNNDIAAVQALLPNSGLNCPFAGTGNTPLHVAALNGYTDIVRLLLVQPRIDTTRTNNNGKTALDLAREKGFTAIVLLLENK